MAETRFDLIVLGVGMAGLNAAKKCADKGLSVAVVDERPYGGTCALRGCDPKKILRRGAEIVNASQMMQSIGIERVPAIDWKSLVRHKDAFVSPMPDKIEGELEEKGIATLHGPARFESKTTVRVNGNLYSAEKFLVATGQRPRTLEFEGAEHAIDSEAFLDLERLPDRIVFVGAGYVSMEFAHIANRAGVKVTVVDRGARPLKSFDPDLVERLTDYSRSLGIEFSFENEISRIDKLEEGGFSVELDDGGGKLHADLIVNGAGRVPQIGHLGLERIDVASNEDGIEVDDFLRSTTNPSVFAAGDCAATSGPPLTPVAVHEGLIAASNIMDYGTRKPDYRGVPSAAFTVPEIVRIGMLEEEAVESGKSFDCRFNDTSDWYSNFRIGASLGAAKILVDTKTDEVIGAHLLGHSYAELANTIAVAMANGITASALRRSFSAYPTTGSDLAAML